MPKIEVFCLFLICLAGGALLNPAKGGAHFLSIIKLFLQVLNPAESGTHFRHFRHFSSLFFQCLPNPRKMRESCCLPPTHTYARKALC